MVEFLNESTKRGGGIVDGAGDRDGNKFSWSISVHTETGFISYGKIEEKRFEEQVGRVKARTAAHSTSDSSLPALCYPGKSTGNGQSVVINQDPLPIILVGIAIQSLSTHEFSGHRSMCQGSHGPIEVAGSEASSTNISFSVLTLRTIHFEGMS